MRRNLSSQIVLSRNTILKHQSQMESAPFMGDDERLGLASYEAIEAWVTIHAGIPTERLEYVRQLKQQGYHLYLLSNNNDVCWRDILEHYDMSVFEDVFLSHILHIIKPQPELFEYVQHKLQLVPDETIFVDDLEANRLAAEQAVGWKTVASLEELKTILLNL